MHSPSIQNNGALVRGDAARVSASVFRPVLPEYGMEVDDSQSSHFIRSLHSCTSRYTSYSITSVLSRFLHLSLFLPCFGLQVISGAASSSAEAAASPTETFPDNPSVAS